MVCTLATGAACSAKAPLRMSFHDGDDDRTVVVFLPGFAATDRTIAKQGVIDAMREAGLRADVVTVDARAAYYFSGDLVPRLREDVIAALAPKYEHVWVMGISMGGFGTLMTAEAFRDEVEGIVLFSPFLGRKPVIQGLEEHGIQGWSPRDEPSWDDDIWSWLQGVDAGGWNEPVVYFGRGSVEDGTANILMEAALPPGRTRIAPGGHQWTVWRQLAAEFVANELMQHEAFDPTVAGTTPHEAEAAAY